MPGISLDTLRNNLQTTLFGRTGIEYHPTLPSTNIRVRDLGSAGAPEGVVIIAEEQTAGRGRLGRTWISPPGVNLYLSLLLRPDLSPARIPLLTLAAAIGAAEAASTESGLLLDIKWPNDLQVRGQKVCGILAEIHNRPESGRFVVLGIGLNVNLSIDQLPEEIIQRGVGSLCTATGRLFDRVRLLGQLLFHLEKEYLALCKGGHADLLRRYRAQCITIGSRVTYSTDGISASGRAVDIDDFGKLVIEQDGSGNRVRVDAGEVTLAGSDHQSRGNMSQISLANDENPMVKASRQESRRPHSHR